MSFANVTSLMALFIALSGIAWAASLPKNSVGAAQIKKDGVSRSEIKKNGVAADEIKDLALSGNELANNAITNGKIADGTVGLADLAANSVDGSKVLDGALSGGDIGDGTIGAADVGNGSLGGGDVAAGTFLGGNVTVQFTQHTADVPAGANVTLDAYCPDGQTAIGGGHRGDDTESEDTTPGSSRPIISTTNGAAPVDNGTFTGWRTTIQHTPGSAATGVRPEVWVICAALPALP
jgi:hypothetical protein